ncbi:nicotianamine aminotransferase 1 isoform X3 [Setaria viridis]|uniref:nicotianamine aminotransferase 1 isoform X3 n=1 Tax=Setaria viridis TaxID=4556 RepID=UPI001493A2BC|nr:nicotianamine aminotransferase 1-like isoform X3 [Setaria viridis]
MDGNHAAGATPRAWRICRQSVGVPLSAAGAMSIRAVLDRVFSAVDSSGPRPVLAIGNGDPTASASFRPPLEAEEAVVEALRSKKHNGYSPTVGFLQARRAIAEYLSQDLPYQLSPDDIYLTAGCCQAIDVMISILAQPGSNILLPKPGFPLYESRTMFSNLEERHFNLIPDRGWEADLESMEALADENTVAMVIINPSNPCGSVYSHDHLAKIAETARKLGIIIIADEVYDHLAFGNKPFIPMGVFADIVPVITLGSISKRWLVPGWRLGWIATCDPNGILKEAKVDKSIESYINITNDPATFIQVKLDLCYLDGILDDLDFCCRLAKEESVIVLPGSALGMKDWIRITFACDIPTLENALERIKSFCQRHANKLEA